MRDDRPAAAVSPEVVPPEAYSHHASKHTLAMLKRVFDTGGDPNTIVCPLGHFEFLPNGDVKVVGFDREGNLYDLTEEQSRDRLRALWDYVRSYEERRYLDAASVMLTGAATSAATAVTYVEQIDAIEANVCTECGQRLPRFNLRRRHKVCRVCKRGRQ